MGSTKVETRVLLGAQAWDREVKDCLVSATMGCTTKRR